MTLQRYDFGLSSYQRLDATARGRALDRQLDGMVPPYAEPPSRSQTQPLFAPPDRHKPSDAAATTASGVVTVYDRGHVPEHPNNQGAFTVPFGLQTAKECILRRQHQTLGSSFAVPTEGRTFESELGVGKAAVPGWDLEGGAVPYQRGPDPPRPKKHPTYSHRERKGGLASLGAPIAEPHPHRMRRRALRC